jgi:hypothetical protein
MLKRSKRPTALLLALFALCALPAAAHAAADIEAVWSFNNGQVAVRANADGTFTGTVIRATQLANCPHPAGEQMWLGVRAQPDGSYWGGHQWYNDAGCTQIPQRGNTAYRVLARPDGARFLRVCFSPPESPELQPKIAPDGSSTDASNGCADSDLVSQLAAGTPKIDKIATLPKQGKRKCLSRRAFTIRLKEPSGDALNTASIFLNGRRVEIRRGDRITAPIRLTGLPKGRYTVKIVAKTVLGKTIQGSRKYRTCAKKRRGGGGGPV